MVGDDSQIGRGRYQAVRVGSELHIRIGAFKRSVHDLQKVLGRLRIFYAFGPNSFLHHLEAEGAR